MLLSFLHIDARGVWRPWLDRKKILKISKKFLKNSPWKYKQFDGAPDLVAPIFPEKKVSNVRGIPWQIRRLYTTTSPKFFKFGSEVSPSEINKTPKIFWVLTPRGRDIGIWNFENLGVPGNFKHQYLSHEAWYKVIWGINLMLMNQTFKIRLLGIFFSTPKKVSP